MDAIENNNIFRIFSVLDRWFSSNSQNHKSVGCLFTQFVHELSRLS